MKTTCTTLLLTLATVATASADPAHDWTSTVNRNHPLVGEIRELPTGDAISMSTLAERAAQARYVLLGETHDNPDHHRLQSRVIAALAARGRRPVVAFEMLDQDQGPAIAQHLAENPKDAEGLGSAVGWSERGWPAWRQYQPIAEAALEAGLQIAPADVQPSVQKIVGRQGFASALTEDDIARLHLHKPLPKKAQANLISALETGHCNMMPAEALEPMARVQRLRDAVMADSLIEAHHVHGEGAILIAGREHVRADRGVPWYLTQRQPNASVFTLGIIDVTQEGQSWQDQLPQTGPSGQAVFDAVWFTPRFDDTDHCEALKARMEDHNPSKKEKP